jgi:hypothetical protein
MEEKRPYKQQQVGVVASKLEWWPVAAVPGHSRRQEPSAALAQANDHQQELREAGDADLSDDQWVG